LILTSEYPALGEVKQLNGGFRPKALTTLPKRLGLSQAGFAKQYMLNLRTLQDWEQGLP
jgi:DNA-binding transcriptional regulator YiaG